MFAQLLRSRLNLRPAGYKRKVDLPVSFHSFRAFAVVSTQPSALFHSSVKYLNIYQKDSKMDSVDKAANQLADYKISNKPAGPATTAHGVAMENKDATMTAGRNGPVLLQDVAFLEEMAHFDRERIPERVVHAKGAGAFGYFEVTHDISKYCAAKIFSEIGKKTKIGMRFSTVGGESGSADTARDPRGFAIKFYTDEGIWDLVGNNTPIFFIRDPILFPSFIHTQKRNPQTHLKDANMFWDFISLRPETVHQTLFMFSDRGIPDGYRHMNGYGSHTYKLVNANCKPIYCKFHHKTDQGIKNMDVKIAADLAGANPDYSIQDLYNAIANGRYPSWTTYIQVMTFEQAEKSKFNPFDLTKIWPQSEYPLIPVGKLVLDKNPDNYFSEVEQIAFSPGHMVPGIEASPDKMLQGRLFAYDDTHRHRLGANFLQLPVNSCPFAVRNYQRDGPMCQMKQGGAPNYHPNSFGGATSCPRAKSLTTSFPISGDAQRYDSGDEDNFTQSSVFYSKVLNDAARARMISNIAAHLKDAVGFIQERMVTNFTKVDAGLGKKVADALKLHNKAKANL